MLHWLYDISHRLEPYSYILETFIYSAGNGQWPGGQMRLIFVWGPLEISKLWTLVAQFICVAIANEWDLQLVAILGH